MVFRLSNRRSVGWLVAISAVVALLVAGSNWLIGTGVHDASEAALRDHPGDRIQALIAYVDSPNHTLRERNRAVWALGRLRDARALPVLEKHFTGETCDHERRLCRYELRKALERCRGGANTFGAIWR